MQSLVSGTPKENSFLRKRKVFKNFRVKLELQLTFQKTEICVYVHIFHTYLYHTYIIHVHISDKSLFTD